MATNSAEAAAEILGTYFSNVKIVKDPASKKAESGDKDGEDTQEELFEKKVCNCLSCGRIFDLRKAATLPHVAAFIASGGVCSCGTMVNTRKQRPMLALADTDEEKMRRAIAFKDRLLEYDRTSAKRTAVVDDQGFMPEVDGNTWLTEEEKTAIKERLRLEEAAREAKKKSTRITIDLLGRRVIEAEEDEIQLPGTSAAAEGQELTDGVSTPEAAASFLDMHIAPATTFDGGKSAPLTFLPTKKGVGKGDQAGDSGGGRRKQTVGAAARRLAQPRVQDAHEEFDMLLQ